MSKTNFWAVKRGRRTGIFSIYEEFQGSVFRYPHSLFRGFKTYEEAEDWLEGRQKNTLPAATGARICSSVILDEASLDLQSDFDAGYVVAFTDGSYSHNIRGFGYAALVLSDPERAIELSGFSSVEAYTRSTNTAGEMAAVLMALRYAERHEIPRLKIYFDFAGIHYLLLNQTKARAPITRLFKEEVFDHYLKTLPHVVFQRVRSHSGIVCHNRADELASMALHARARYHESELSDALSRLYSGAAPVSMPQPDCSVMAAARQMTVGAWRYEIPDFARADRARDTASLTEDAFRYPMDLTAPLTLSPDHPEERLERSVDGIPVGTYKEGRGTLLTFRSPGFTPMGYALPRDSSGSGPDAGALLGMSQGMSADAPMTPPRVLTVSDLRA